MEQNNQPQKPKKDMKFFYGFTAGFAIMAILALFINSHAQAVATTNTTKFERQELCINMSLTNAYRLVSHMPYDPSINQSKMGFVTYNQYKNWSHNLTKNKFALQNNYVTC